MNLLLVIELVSFFWQWFWSPLDGVSMIIIIVSLAGSDDCDLLVIEEFPFLAVAVVATVEYLLILFSDDYHDTYVGACQTFFLYPT